MLEILYSKYLLKSKNIIINLKRRVKLFVQLSYSNELSNFIFI